MTQTPVASIPRILVADDDDMCRAIIAEILAGMGIAFALAADGEEVLSLARSARFAAILLDYCMPKLSGAQVIAALSRDHGDDCPPIIAMTAFDPRDEAVCGSAAAIRGFLRKPFGQGDIARVLDACGFALRKVPAADGRQRSPASAINPPVIDADRLAALGAFPGKERPGDFLNNLLAIFLRQAPQFLAAVESAVHRRNWAAAGDTAHHLVGLCRNVGALTMADLAAQLDAACQRGTYEDTPELLGALAEHFALVSHELKANWYKGVA